ncbi:hypothetical protein [Rhizobium sp. PAMB 3182]
MSNGPFIPGREAQPFDLLQQGVAGNGWEGVEELLKPVLQVDTLKPDDELARFMYGLSCTPQGRQMFEWMMDNSIRQPLRATGATFEETALRTALRQGINGYGEMVLAAIAEGHKLVNQSKTQNGAG